MIVAIGIGVFYIVPLALLAEILRCVCLEYRRDRIPILLYHRLIAREAVRAGRLPDREPIYAAYDDVFAGQMKHLHDHAYTTLSMDEFLEIRRGARPRPARPVVLTFDDGYASNYTLALPVLRAQGQKATVFVAPEPDSYTRQQVAGVDAFLTQEQMREMDRDGVTIESHTLTHCVLSELNDREATFELTESKCRLGMILDRPVRHLAVPRSGHSRRVRQLARRAGYLTVCCNGKGSSNGLSSLMALPRIVIERDMSVDDFARTLTSRTAVLLRLVGNLKRLPALLFGSSAATRFRYRLYGGTLAPLFAWRRLKRLILCGTVVYLIGIAVFTWYLLVR